MVPDSPAEALGPWAPKVSEMIVDVVRARHSCAAEAHQVAHTRNTRGYSTLWQDLLVDTQEKFRNENWREVYKLTPGGHKVPVVNNCLIYVWRVPASGDPARFAESLTRKACFDAPLPEPALFEPDFTSRSTLIAAQVGSDPAQSADPETVVRSVDGNMPVVIVKAYSSPLQLQMITWAVAELDRETGKVSYRGEETIWQAEPVTDPYASDVESFAAGTPVEPVVELREQESVDSDAR